MSTFIDISAIQSVPPSNLNRDENGSPKQAQYGGVNRHRVSSQAWKRANREYYNEHFAGDNKGFRTKNVVPLIASALRDIQDISLDESVEKVISALVASKLLPKKTDEQKAKAKAAFEKSVADAIKKGEEVPVEQNEIPTTSALFLISQSQIRHVAEAIAETEGQEEKFIKAAITKSLLSQNSFDLALFGRMVAEAKGLNVEASCQYAHAISTHAVSPEFDWFTASDDLSERGDAGVAMIGDTEFISSTLYRFASVNATALLTEFSEDREVVAQAVVDFIESFIRSLPSGKQNSFAGLTLPDAIVVSVRKSPLSYVGAFERPIVSRDGYAIPSVKRLVEKIQDDVDSFDTEHSFKFGVGSSEEIRSLLAKVSDVSNLTELKQKVRQTIIENL